MQNRYHDIRREWRYKKLKNWFINMVDFLVTCAIFLFIGFGVLAFWIGVVELVQITAHIFGL